MLDLNRIDTEIHMPGAICGNGDEILNHMPELKNIWDINPNLKCPVIGTCLSIEEHRRILKKTGYLAKKMKPYELHRCIMENLHCRNRVSAKVNSHLRHKYKKETQQLLSLSEKELKEKWQDGLNTGEIEAPLYIIASRKGVSDTLLMNVFGEAHMLAHTNTSEVMKAKRELMLQKAGSEKLMQQLQDERKKTIEKKEEIASLRAQLDEALKTQGRKPFADPPEKKQTSGGSQEELKLLREKNARLKSRMNRQASQIDSLTRKKNDLKANLSELQAVNRKLSTDIQNFLTQAEQIGRMGGHCNREECPEFDLCEKRILIVGGITRMKNLYREIVESNGGRFDYHDGYMTNAKHNLEARVKRSDLIICPVNCNSHGACLKVKKLCQKHNKDIKMLPSSSLTAISDVLQTTAN